MAANEDGIVAGEMEDETCDQTGSNSAEQEDQEPDKPEESTIRQDNAGHNPPAMANASPANAESSSDKRPPVDRKDMSSNGNNSVLSRDYPAMYTASGGITEGIVASGAKMFEDKKPDKPEESNIQQDNAGHNPPAMANASPANTESSSDKSPPIDRKDMSSNGNNSVRSRARDVLPYAAIGVGTGIAAVAATPLVLGAAGFTAGGVVAGSAAAFIQSAVYGGSVASGSAFALLQSAGAAGIGAASSTAIGGITGGIAALGARMANKLRTGIKLLICGWGSEARVFAGIASSVKGTEVRVLPDSWKMLTNDFKVTFHRKGDEPTCIVYRLPPVTHNPEDAMQDIDIVVFMLPASAHEDFLQVLKPYIKPGIIMVGLPGKPGFEVQVREALGDVGQQCTIMNFEASPWVCRSTEFGVDCEVLGTKDTLLGAIKKGKDVAPKKDPVSTLQSLLGPLPKLIVSGHLLGIQLMSVNAYLHTSILYGQWEGWQGNPVDEPPLFYNGLTEPAADLLSSISDEIVNIARVIELKTEADMSHVVPIHQWLVRRYSHDISNKSTLYQTIQTNATFQGIKHPVKTTEDGKFVPDFTHRYMTEDVPYGLVVIRGIAEIVGVETPNIDKVLTWCQEKMGKEYLVSSKLQGKDVASSRAPQRYGFTTIEYIL